MINIVLVGVFFFQAEDGIRDLVRSRGLGDVYKRQGLRDAYELACEIINTQCSALEIGTPTMLSRYRQSCLLYTSDAADERSSVDLGGRRIIKKKTYNRI